MADPKYANLPGIASNEPDVYETSDLPEDDQAQFESTGRRPELAAGLSLRLLQIDERWADEELSEELCSDSVERIVVNPNAAYDKFKDKHVGTKGLGEPRCSSVDEIRLRQIVLLGEDIFNHVETLSPVDFSDRISKDRRVGYESGDYELLAEGCGLKETPQQKYQRLVHEIHELCQDVEHIQTSTKASNAEERLTPVALAQQAAQLKQQLVSAHLDSVLGPDAHINLADPDGALAKRLLTQLEATRGVRSGGSAEGKTAPPAGPDGVILYEIHSRPQQEKFNESAKIADLERRLAELELAVGSSSDKRGPLSAGLQGASVTETMELLQARVGALDASTLDQVEARLQSVLGKMNEIAKHKASVEDAETQSKVSQLYDLVQQWDAVSSSLPLVVQRLTAVRDLHEQAMQFGQLLAHLDTTQQMISNSLKDDSSLLAQVQQTMKENLLAVEENFSALDQRMKKLNK
ncbi:hypothetical protein DNTS_032008 [Danionella cerebrum]|uniref:Dynactin subunit 2 n=1 Tax=Danionella cerebrum TaxID=2873325 RepID=A0A553R9Q9_9TELE|nr:hypothetical protein DNTS_032008 [Danionella translucida]